MSKLEELLEQCKSIVMTPEDRREQAISFAYGNAGLSNPKITKEIVEEAYDKWFTASASNPPKLM